MLLAVWVAFAAAVALVGWLTYVLLRTKRDRGYLLFPPPGKHSASRRPGVIAKPRPPRRQAMAPRYSPAAVATPARVRASGVASSPAASPVAAPAPMPASAVAPAPVIAPAAPAPAPPAPAAPAVAVVQPDRRLVAPVELWFGEVCVGVVAGSETHRSFQHYASALLAELNVPAKRAYRAAPPVPAHEGWLAKRRRLRNGYAREPMRR